MLPIFKNSKVFPISLLWFHQVVWLEDFPNLNCNNYSVISVSYMFMNNICQALFSKLEQIFISISCLKLMQRFKKVS